MPDERRTAQPTGTALPQGVCLAGGPAGVELTIQASTPGELVWRIHDLVPLIQDGRLAQQAQAAMNGQAKPDPKP